MKIRLVFQYLFLACALCFTSINVKAQVVVDQTMTVEELVNDVILGEGVNASNITFNGAPGDQVSLQTGAFEADGIDFPIGEGLVMATGNAQMMAPSGSTIIIDNFEDDPDLMAIAGFPVNNCAIIEFDFTVESDSVIFDYIFASNEYTSFTCSNFNDVFGFFLSGAGIDGPFTSPAGFPDGSINIALIPGSDTPVGVNTVNSGVPSSGNPQPCLDANPNFEEDSQYFINNAGGQSGIAQYLNGHTTLLTARSPIQCGETYHIKMGIANSGGPGGTDQGLQSAVFLRKGSFSASGEVFLSVTPSLPGVNLEGSGFENVVVAGCFSPLVELVRPEGAPVGSISVSYGGTATEGVDYVLGENDTLFAFSEGIDTLFFNVTTFSNPAAEDDTLFLDFFVIYEVCDGFDTLTASLPIVQPYEYSSETENVDVFCPADSTVITAQGVDGVGPYNYNWVGENPGESVLVPVPPDAKWYIVEITDQCEFDTVVDSVLVTNLIPPALSLDIPQTVEPLCPRMPVTIDAFVADGNGEYAYEWSEPITDPDDFSSITVAFPQTQYVFLTVTDTCGTSLTDSVQVLYPDYENIEIAFDLDRRACPDGALNLRADVTGGAGEYNIVWSEADGKGRFETPEEAQTAYEPEPGYTALRLDVVDQCFAMGFAGPYLGVVDDQDTLRTIDLSQVPNVITPNGDGRNDYFAVPGLDVFPGSLLQVWDRWGGEVFESEDYTVVNQGTGRPSNAFGGEDRPDGSYFYVLNVNNGECVKTGYIDILGSNIPSGSAGR